MEELATGYPHSLGKKGDLCAPRVIHSFMSLQSPNTEPVVSECRAVGLELCPHSALNPHHKFLTPLFGPHGVEAQRVGISC